MKQKILLFALLSVVLLIPANAEIIAGPDVAVIETESGKLQGYIRDGIFTYHGVPYAESEPFMPLKIYFTRQ